jgi:hypothetical protein
VDSTALDVYIGSALPVVERMRQEFEAIAGILDQGPAAPQACLTLSATDSPLGQLRNDAAQLRVLSAPTPLTAYQDQLRLTAAAADDLAERVMASCGGGDSAALRDAMRALSQQIAASLSALRGYGTATPLPPSSRDPGAGTGDESSALYEVTNETGSALYIELSGPRRTSLIIPDRGTEQLRLPPGDYRVLAVVNATTVSPLRGEERLEAGATARARYTTRPSGSG